MDLIAKNLIEIQDQIREMAESAGRKSAEVKLVAVSKTKPVELIQEAYNAGQRIFGENRIQELETKVGSLPGDIEWHLIGHLQSNKAIKAVNLAPYIHSVDSIKLLERLNRLAGENRKKPKILLEINISGEKSKFGAENESEVMNLAEKACQSENLDFAGLMTMAPFDARENELHKIFAGLRELRNKLESQFTVKLPELSMGMSSDYEIAIQEGATLVRIGTAIFGSRYH